MGPVVTCPGCHARHRKPRSRNGSSSRHAAIGCSSPEILRPCEALQASFVSYLSGAGRGIFSSGKRPLDRLVAFVDALRAARRGERELMGPWIPVLDLRRLPVLGAARTAGRSLGPVHGRPSGFVHHASDSGIAPVEPEAHTRRIASRAPEVLLEPRSCGSVGCAAVSEFPAPHGRYSCRWRRQRSSRRRLAHSRGSRTTVRADRYPSFQ